MFRFIHFTPAYLTFIFLIYCVSGLHTQGKMVFDSYEAWQAPYGPVRISVLRDKITCQLPRSEYVILDSLQDVEHSLEALIPFLQYYNPCVEIVPILKPAMDPGRMEGLAGSLAWAISKVMDTDDLEWMKDFALVISNDAVHYECDCPCKHQTLWGIRSYGIQIRS